MSDLYAPPSAIDLVRALRLKLGMSYGAMPITPEEAWAEAMGEVERLMREPDYEAARHALVGIIELELEVDTLAEAARAIVDAAWRVSGE